MIRSSLSFTVLAAALATSLFTAPRLAAQSTARPAVAESGSGQDDAVNLRRLVNDESQHRDRIARLTRLRALAEKQGLRERLADLDRLDRLERERHEARRLATHSRLSQGAQREADEFTRRGGALKLRRANNAATTGVRRTPTRTGTERSLPQRRASSSTRRPHTGLSSRSASRGGRTGSGGRSPR